MGFLRPTRWTSGATDKTLIPYHREASTPASLNASHRSSTVSLRESARRKDPPQERLLPVPQISLELAEGEAVDHAPLLDPGPPSLREAVLHKAEGPLVVGIRVDGDPDACSHGLAHVGNREVEAVDVGVELEGRVRGGGLPDQTRHVHRIRFPAVQDAARGVPDGPHMRIVHGPHYAVGHLLLADPERGVHGGHDEVQLGENIVLVVEGAVLEDVDLRSAEELDLIVTLVGLPHGLHLLLQALGREAVRHPEATGVVAEDEVLVAELDGRLGHALDGAFAVRVVGVNVQVSADVFDGDEVGQAAAVSRFDLTSVLPQLRRYVAEAEPRVEILLRGDGLVVAGPRSGQAVLGDVDAHLDGPLAQRDVVGLAAGKVVQKRAVGLGIYDPQVYLGPAAQDKDL